MTKEIKIWCETCKEWHEISTWDEISQLENWGCALDFEHPSDDDETKK